MEQAIPTPPRRTLHAYAYDPLLSELNNTEVKLSVPFEPLKPGPEGGLVKVIDFDPIRDTYYAPVHLDDPLLLAQDGLAPSESDPRFHQQMVYAVSSSVLEYLERALGRRLQFVGGKPLTIYPHAFCDQNAYYDPDLHALLFGYFRAGRDTPGRLLPGQWVFTCLSHDIIAHELTHAVVDRLRPEFIFPTNHDVAAFHEGFADLIALLHHFTLPDIVRRHLQASRGDIARAAPLFDLAQQFGEGAGMGEALRSGIDKPDPARLAMTLECHDRGAILVAAVFEAFIETYKERVADLLRIATGGTGELPRGHLHPDLVTRVASEAQANARDFLSMCVRAFDFLPVVDVTFGDFLRALVTADRSLYPGDRSRKRAWVIESFRRRGIYPDDVDSLSEQSLSWPTVTLPEITLPVDQLIEWTAEESEVSTRSATRSPATEKRLEKRRADQEVFRRGLAAAMHKAVTSHPAEFGLSPDHPIAVRGFHASFRPGEDGQSRVDIVVQLRQERPDLGALPALDGTGLRVFAGTTVVADALGRIRHVITKPLPRDARRPHAGAGGDRFARLLAFISDRDAIDGTEAWTSRPNRITSQLSFAQLHRNRAMGAIA